MSHTIRLTFGPIVSIEITRDSKRRVTHIHTFFNDMLEGYQLDTNPDTREGSFRPVPSNSIGERYFEGRIHSPPALGEMAHEVRSLGSSLSNVSSQTSQQLRGLMDEMRALQLTVEGISLAVSRTFTTISA